MSASGAEGRYATMQYRRCGNSGLRLPAISLGAWETFGGYRDETVARACIQRAFDLGITHFDLANNYGKPAGNAELVCGRILHDLPRDELIIATKAGFPMWPGPYGDGGSRKYLIASCDQSLRRLGVDYVDIFYHHRPDPQTPIEETIGALATLVRGNVETWIASTEFTAQQGILVESTPIGTLGDRIVLDHLRWFGKPGGEAFEFERVRLLEVGADGLLRAVLFFDPEDRFAASVEGLARFVAGEAAGSAGIAPMLAFSRALHDRDWETARDCYPPDVAFVDHRPLSFGALDRDSWIAALRANDDLSVGLTWDLFRVLAWSEQGFAVGIRRLGAVADGGGPFENELFAVALVVDGRFQRYELFDVADAERAVARFAELCAEDST